MKPIQLTIAHTRKLQEMANYFFDYKHIYVDDLNSDSVVDIPEQHALTFNNDEDWDDFSMQIHWFEFCVLHLARKIFIDEAGDTVSYYLSSLFDFYYPNNKDYNIIDHLYEQFKLLKNE